MGDWTNEKLNDPGFFDAYLSKLRLEGQVDVKKDVTGRLGPTLFAVDDAHGPASGGETVDQAAHVRHMAGEDSVAKLVCRRG